MDNVVIIDECYDKLQILTQNVWDAACGQAEVAKWLEQFNGKCLPAMEERSYMIYALTKFMFFSQRMMREMIISLYRDNIRSSIIQEIRKNNENTTDIEVLNKLYDEELKKTCFIGVGNPSESGAHLLYIFRQVNNLKKNLFKDVWQAFDLTSKDNIVPRDPKITRYIFFDDFVGGGTQVDTYLGGLLQCLKRDDSKLNIKFISLFATTQGLAYLNEEIRFNGSASTVFELDKSYKSCQSDARYFQNTPEWFDHNKFIEIAKSYGKLLYEDYPLGHSNCELMIGFSHNTPNNTLPIFWKHSKIGEIWFPVFERFDKNYGLLRKI